MRHEIFYRLKKQIVKYGKIHRETQKVLTSLGLHGAKLEQLDSIGSYESGLNSEQRKTCAKKEEKRIAPQHMLSSSHGCSFVRISMTFKRRKSTLLHLIRCLFSGCFKFLRSCFCDTLWPSEQSEKSPFSHFPYFTF